MIVVYVLHASYVVVCIRVHCVVGKWYFIELNVLENEARSKPPYTILPHTYIHIYTASIGMQTVSAHEASFSAEHIEYVYVQHTQAS